MSEHLTGGEKAELIADYHRRYPLGVVVETGVWGAHGSTFGLAGRASIFAIELDPERAAGARAAHPEVVIVEGDAAIELPRLLSEVIGEPALFWLDAHLVAEAGEENHSPVMAELEAIIAWPHAASSVVLIDDVRMMGRDGWPTVEEVLSLGSSTWRDQYADDILRFTPHP